MDKIHVPARLESLEVVSAFVRGAMQYAGMDPKRQTEISIAVEEVFVNILSYAYPSGTGEVTIMLPVGPDGLRIIFMDTGIPFNPLTHADPDLSLPADERDVGGLGIYLIKKMTDNIEYRYEKGANILTLEYLALRR